MISSFVKFSLSFIFLNFKTAILHKYAIEGGIGFQAFERIKFRIS